MTNLLSIGTSALMTYRRALDTVSHNIANVNTEGYSRQRIELEARIGNTVGVQTQGNGVDVSRVRRLTDGFVSERLISEQSTLGRLSTYSNMASDIDSWLSSTDTGLSSTLEGFFSALNDLSANPSSTAARATVLGSSQGLAERFVDFSNRFRSMDQEIDSRLSGDVDQINAYATQLAELNDRIARSRVGGEQNASNDLMDQRDQLLQNLSGLVSISTTETDSNGAVNVFIGNGQSLVLGVTANQLSVESDEYGRPRDIVMHTGSGSSGSLTSQLSGGDVGGLLDFRREVLEPATNELGRLSIALSTAMNAQHALGVDQNGDPGGQYFSTTAPVVTPASTNTGTAALGVTISDATALQGREYEMIKRDSGWVLRTTPSHQEIPMTGSGTAADPFVAEGLSLVVSGSEATGDRFLVQPTHFAAGDLSVMIDDPGKIAAAGALQAQPALSNAGTAEISAATVTDLNNTALRDPVTIQFTDANTYSINGAGSYTYTSGSPISVNGWEVTINGDAAAGDSFSVGPTQADSGDNRNARLLADISNLKLLDGGRNTLGTANSAMVTRVGSQSAQADAQYSAQSVLHTQTLTARDSVAGVNLDEEAAELMRFEQAYNAAAQVIATAGTLFDTLLSVVRR